MTKDNDAIISCGSIGEEILNSLAVISGISQMLLKDAFPAEYLILNKEVETINKLVRNYFDLQMRRW